MISRFSISSARGPLTRTMAMPPSPGAVAKAVMVSEVYKCFKSLRKNDCFE